MSCDKCGKIRNQMHGQLYYKDAILVYTCKSESCDFEKLYCGGCSDGMGLMNHPYCPPCERDNKIDNILK